MPRSSRLRNANLFRENDPPFLVLMSLATGPKHGHALIQDIEAFASVRLGPGTLYGAIARLETEGLIEGLETDGRRRPYRLSASGATSLERVLAEMDRLVQTGRERLVVLRPELRATW